MVQADGLVRSAQAAGLVQPDHIHLTAEAIAALPLNCFLLFVEFPRCVRA